MSISFLLSKHKGGDFINDKSFRALGIVFSALNGLAYAEVMSGVGFPAGITVTKVAGVGVGVGLGAEIAADDHGDVCTAGAGAGTVVVTCGSFATDVNVPAESGGGSGLTAVATR